MKKLYRIFFFLVLVNILIPIVKAEDIEEYSLLVNANNTVSVYDENMNLKLGSFL